MRQMKKETARLGSLFRDVAHTAQIVAHARALFDVTVWINPQGDLMCSPADCTPELHAEYVVGTYGVGSNVTDICEDLIAFREERVSNAIHFV